MKSPLSRSARWIGRYRPYVALVVTVALAVLAPRLREGGDSTPASVAGSSTAGTAAVAGDGAAPADTGLPRLGPAAAPEASATGPAGAPGTASAKVTYPGVGTPAALANPKCDPKTGRIRFPSLFAPECVAPWPAGADNGGATAQGVTKDAIRIVLYEVANPQADNPASKDRATRERQATDILQAFARNYELWGRKLEIHFIPATGDDEASQRADAVQAYNTFHPFMASSYMDIGGPTPLVWATELAAKGVISWDSSVPYSAAHAQPGLRWGYNPDDRLSAQELGEYVGKRLAKSPVRWAGDGGLNGEPRSFGLVYDDTWDRGTFESVLGRFGGRITDAVSFTDSTDLASLQQQATTQIARLKSKGVNNVIVVAGGGYTGALTKAATTQNFKPEWTMSGWNLQDTAILSRLYYETSQWRHAFGIGLVPPLESPTSISERSRIYQWAYGGKMPEDDATNGQVYLLAKAIVAGLQLAGPNLTPASFRDAMFRMAPKGGKWCGCSLHNGMSFGRHIAGYPGDKYFDVDDFAEKWWDGDAVGEDEIGLTAAGRYRVVAGGKRYSPGDWPTSEPDVFNPETAVIGYSDPPPNDRVPSYPPPSGS